MVSCFRSGVGCYISSLSRVYYLPANMEIVYTYKRGGGDRLWYLAKSIMYQHSEQYSSKYLYLISTVLSSLEFYGLLTIRNQKPSDNNNSNNNNNNSNNNSKVERALEK